MADRGGERKDELGAAYNALLESYQAAKPAAAAPAPFNRPAAEPRKPAGKEELLNAWDQVRDHEANRPTYAPPRPAVWRRFVGPAVIVASVLGAAYLSLVKPAWLYPPFVPVEVELTDDTASQYAITAAMLTESFYEEQGRLPFDAGVIGFENAGVELLDRGDGRYEVRVAGPTTIFVAEGTVRPGATP